MVTSNQSNKVQQGDIILNVAKDKPVILLIVIKTLLRTHRDIAKLLSPRFIDLTFIADKCYVGGPELRYCSYLNKYILMIIPSMQASANTREVIKINLKHVDPKQPLTEQYLN